MTFTRTLGNFTRRPHAGALPARDAWLETRRPSPTRPRPGRLSPPCAQPSLPALSAGDQYHAIGPQLFAARLISSSVGKGQRTLMSMKADAKNKKKKKKIDRECSVQLSILFYLSSAHWSITSKDPSPHKQYTSQSVQ